MPKVDWSSIDTVLLDMDGTLIDKRHEDEFWTTAVPKAYAAKNKTSLDEARNKLYPMFREQRGKPEWSNLDYWAKTLDIDIWGMRAKTVGKMKLHPHTLQFLKFIRKTDKKIYLVTAATPKDMEMKIKIKNIASYFDGVFTQHGLGSHKEDVAFWRKVRKVTCFDPRRTLLADDDELVLKAAKAFGMKWLVFKTAFNSAKPHQKHNGFLCVRHFDDIIS